MPDYFSAIRQQTTEWLKASGYHRSDLAKELGWSESFLSEFMSGKSGLGGLSLCQLTSVVSQPPKLNKINKGARICGIQSMGRTIRGILELDGDTMDKVNDNHAMECATVRDEFNNEVNRINGGK